MRLSVGSIIDGIHHGLYLSEEKSIGYIDALLTYFKAEVGFFVIGVIGISTILLYYQILLIYQ